MSVERYLIFEINREFYAAELAYVAEIMDPPTLYPLPGVPGYYKGSMNFHGTPMPVVDVSMVCKDMPCRGSGKVIALDAKAANLALLVDDVVYIMKGDFASRHPSEAEPCVERIIVTSGGEIKVIEPEKLVDKLEKEING